MKRYVTTKAIRLDAVLAEMNLDGAAARTAIREGRVFVARKRATSMSESIEPNVAVYLHDPRPSVPLPTPFVLLHRDAMLAVDKPAGIPTIPDLEGSRGSLVDVAARTVHENPDDLHPTSRLDREVSGIVTFTLDDVARRRVSAARARGAYRRLYVAISAGDLPSDRLVWRSPIAPDPRDPRKRRALDVGASPTDAKTTDAKEATSRVVVVRRAGVFRLLALAPETGRTHQLRVHASHAGAPLLGDVLYGGERRLVTTAGAVRMIDRIALHCAAVDIELAGQEKISLRSPVPPSLVALADHLGLAPGDGMTLVEEALRCDPWSVI